MLWNTLLLALREIRRNVLRSVLTMLGIVIGVAAVIVMVTLGDGATRQVTAQIESLGTNLLMITMGQRMGPGSSSNAPPFTLDDVVAVQREIGAVSAVAGSASQVMTAVVGNSNWSTTVTGSDNRFFAVRNWRLDDGRLFTEPEQRAGRAVCVIGATVRRELFGYQDPIGQKIRLKQIACEVIGLLASKGQSAMGSDQDDLVVMPLRTFQRRVAGNQEVNLIQLSVRDGDSTEQVKSDIERMMRERRHVHPADQDNFSVRDMKEIATMLTGTTRVLTALLSAVAAVSLLVGGIGIMNIMLVSVTERTREIGIRMAVGAKTWDIRLQFIIEALSLSLIGGFVGIAGGIITSKMISFFTGWSTVVSSLAILMAFGFSGLVGIFFGFYPAYKASLLNPIEALHYE